MALLGYTCRDIPLTKDSFFLDDNCVTASPLGITEDTHYTIRTDNGGELAGSSRFTQTIVDHNYVLETIAPDGSTQNSISEQPHRTLKERRRCLLYMVRLNIELWSYVLIHTTWLYN